MIRAANTRIFETWDQSNNFLNLLKMAINAYLISKKRSDFVITLFCRDLIILTKYFNVLKSFCHTFVSMTSVIKSL